MKPSSKQLVIDTATSHIFLALIIDGHLVEDIWQEGASNHSVTVMPHIEAMLSKHQCQLNELTGLYIGIGPGSYTGVRIGVAIAKMIGYLNQIPLYSFSTLALLATASDSVNILSYVDARRGNAFLATFKQENQILSVVQEDCLTEFDPFVQTLNSDYDRIFDQHPQVMKLVNSGLYESVENVHLLVPNYLQITEAEKNRVQE
jgi:tRNA threonylcarbamoyladenosine biosynthesis protein TsaB